MLIGAVGRVTEPVVGHINMDNFKPVGKCIVQVSVPCLCSSLEICTQLVEKPSIFLAQFMVHENGKTVPFKMCIIALLDSELVSVVGKKTLHGSIRVGENGNRPCVTI